MSFRCKELHVSRATLVYCKVGNRFPVSRVAVNLRHKLPTLLPKTRAVTFTSTCLVNSRRQLLRHYLYCVTCFMISNRCRRYTLDATTRHTRFVPVFLSYWVYGLTTFTIVHIYLILFNKLLSYILSNSNRI